MAVLSLLKKSLLLSCARWFLQLVFVTWAVRICAGFESANPHQILFISLSSAGLGCEMCHRRLRFLTPWLVRQLLGGRVAAVAVSFPSLLSSRLYSSTSNSTPANPLNKKASLVAPPQEPRQFYRRPLPASCIAFSTVEGRQIFKETLEMGFLESFFDLAPQLRTQVSFGTEINRVHRITLNYWKIYY